MKKHLPFLLAAGLMLLTYELASLRQLERLLQLPSGHLAAFFLGAPASYDGELVHISVEPLLTVSRSCSGARLFAILTGLLGGYWCGRRLLRWLALLPLCYGLALLSNSARIAAGWHVHTISNHLIPEWLQEFAHMGIGIVWSLTIVALLVYFITRSPKLLEEPTP